MAIVFTPYTDPTPGNQTNGVGPDQLRRIYGTLNVGTHASGGVELDIDDINAAFTNTQEQIETLYRVDPLGCSVDGLSKARWVNATSKFQVFTDDGTSGIPADAGTADLSSANKTFDVCVVCK